MDSELPDLRGERWQVKARNEALRVGSILPSRSPSAHAHPRPSKSTYQARRVQVWTRSFVARCNPVSGLGRLKPPRLLGDALPIVRAVIRRNDSFSRPRHAGCRSFRRSLLIAPQVRAAPCPIAFQRRSVTVSYSVHHCASVSTSNRARFSSELQGPEQISGGC